ncbi:MAG: hypothetical protein CMF59_12995 [Leptospiraceae bacterium]|nr:hypothetical protein [Leptospiraceae bacterium]
MTIRQLRNLNPSMSFATALLVSFIISGCAILPPTLPETGPLNTKEELARYLNNITDAGDPPGLSFIAIQGDRTVFSRGFGLADPETNRKATAGDVYQWWSITKIFTAVAVMQLQEQGLLSIKDPIKKYIPFFRAEWDGEDVSNSITIEQLLSHTSGLSDAGPEIIGWIHYEGDPHPNQTDLFRIKLEDYTELDFVPGSKAQYSNIGYMALAALIEKRSGMSYEEFIRKSILHPLKMERTDFVYSEEMKDHESVGSHPIDFMSYLVPIYIDMDKAIRKKDDRYWFNRLYSDQKGSTGLIGSPEDLGRFMKALLGSGSYDGVRILSGESVQEMMQTRATFQDGQFEGYGIGLGWFIKGEGQELELAHGGAGAAFVCMMRLYPNRDMGMAIMANSTYLGRQMGIPVLDAGAPAFPVELEE